MSSEYQTNDSDGWRNIRAKVSSPKIKCDSSSAGFFRLPFSSALVFFSLFLSGFMCKSFSVFFLLFVPDLCKHVRNAMPWHSWFSHRSEIHSIQWITYAITSNYFVLCSFFLSFFRLTCAILIAMNEMRSSAHLIRAFFIPNFIFFLRMCSTSTLVFLIEINKWPAKEENPKIYDLEYAIRIQR